MRILGVDPGLANTGWSVVECENNKYTILQYGVIKTSPDEETHTRIKKIADSLKEIAVKNECKLCGAEDIFFTKNVSSALSVAKVIGALIYALSTVDVEVRLFTPTEIKNAIVGYGGADKEQIRKMVMFTTNSKEKIKSDHAADSVAGAITASTTNNFRSMFSTSQLLRKKRVL